MLASFMFWLCSGFNKVLHGFSGFWHVEGAALSGMHSDGVGGRDLETGTPHCDPFVLYFDANEAVRWAYLKESTAI